ncbi:hypothetical protein BRAS3843_230014 [Bradyrhizobium sp. STM 3843]|nr:hypothetical protein BRAS3843_230014 [Bradyrhizobium sp. STM 3843]
MNAHAVPQWTADGLTSAAELDAALSAATPQQVIAAALDVVGRERLAAVSSCRYGIGGAVESHRRCRSCHSRDLPRHRLAVRGNAELPRSAGGAARPA